MVAKGGTDVWRDFKWRLSVLWAIFIGLGWTLLGMAIFAPPDHYWSALIYFVVSGFYVGLSTFGQARVAGE